MANYTIKDIIYLAGLFDGEGCIHINRWRNKYKNGHRYSLLVQIKMCDGRLLPSLHEKFGGNIRTDQRSLRNPNHSDIAIWRVETNAAMKLLKMILPYLRLKHKQAKLGINFQLKINSNSGSHPVPIREMRRRDRCYQKMKDLKKEERKYSLPV